MLLRTVVALHTFLHLGRGIGQFLAQQIVCELGSVLALGAVLQHIGVLGQGIGGSGHQLLILCGAHLRANSRNLELRQLGALKQSSHGHQLVILLGGFLIEDQQTLGLLIFGGGRDGEHRARPSVVHGNHRLGDVLGNGRVFGHTAAALVDRGLADANVQLGPAHNGRISIGILGLIGFIDRLENLQANLLLLCLGQIRRNLGGGISSRRRQLAFTGGQRHDQRHAGEGGHTQFVPSLVHQLSSCPSSAESSPVLTSWAKREK